MWPKYSVYYTISFIFVLQNGFKLLFEIQCLIDIPTQPVNCSEVKKHKHRYTEIHLVTPKENMPWPITHTLLFIYTFTFCNINQCNDPASTLPCFTTTSKWLSGPPSPFCCPRLYKTVSVLSPSRCLFLQLTNTRDEYITFSNITVMDV